MYLAISIKMSFIQNNNRDTTKFLGSFLSWTFFVAWKSFEQPDQKKLSRLLVHRILVGDSYQFRYILGVFKHI